MNAINYNGRKFRSVNNSPNGEVDADTVFHYSQKDEIVWAVYHGGAIRWGTLIAKVDEAGNLETRYQHYTRRDHDRDMPFDAGNPPRWTSAPARRLAMDFRRRLQRPVGGGRDLILKTNHPIFAPTSHKQFSGMRL